MQSAYLQCGFTPVSELWPVGLLLLFVFVYFNLAKLHPSLQGCNCHQTILRIRTYCIYAHRNKTSLFSVVSWTTKNAELDICLTAYDQRENTNRIVTIKSTYRGAMCKKTKKKKKKERKKETPLNIELELEYLMADFAFSEFEPPRFEIRTSTFRNSNGD